MRYIRKSMRKTSKYTRYWPRQRCLRARHTDGLHSEHLLSSWVVRSWTWQTTVSRLWGELLETCSSATKPIDTDMIPILGTSLQAATTSSSCLCPLTWLVGIICVIISSWTSFTFVWNELDQTGTKEHSIQLLHRTDVTDCQTVKTFCRHLKLFSV